MVSLQFFYFVYYLIGNAVPDLQFFAMALLHELQTHAGPPVASI